MKEALFESKNWSPRELFDYCCPETKKLQDCFHHTSERQKKYPQGIGDYTGNGGRSQGRKDASIP